jgi:hypothetical protein
MRILRRTFWYLLQLAAVGYLFVIGGALYQIPFTISYEEAKVRFGDNVPNDCRSFVVMGRFISKHRPYYCQPILSEFENNERMFILVWSFIGNCFIIFASAKPDRGFTWGGRSKRLT